MKSLQVNFTGILIVFLLIQLPVAAGTFGALSASDNYLSGENFELMGGGEFKAWKTGFGATFAISDWAWSSAIKTRMNGLYRQPNKAGIFGLKYFSNTFHYPGR